MTKESLKKNPIVESESRPSKDSKTVFGVNF